MKIAYIVTEDSTSCGVSKKIQVQCEAWRRLGHNVQIFIRAEKNYKDYNAYFFWKRFNMFNPFLRLILDLIRFNPDCIYMREEDTSLFTFILFIIFHNKIVLEINSRYKSEAAIDAYSSLTNFRIYLLNSLFFSIRYRTARGLVFVTRELSLFPEYKHAKNKCIFPNSINCYATTYRKNPTAIPPIKLFFLGSPNQEWHGVDKLFTLAKLLGDGFEIHIIGAASKECHNITYNNIKFHEYTTSYESIVSTCHIAVSSLALHRKKMNEACALKTREYLAAGFPTILAYKDTAFCGINPDFLLEIDNIENNFSNYDNIKNIKDFCQKYAMTVIQNEDIRKYIDASCIEPQRMKTIQAWFK